MQWQNPKAIGTYTAELVCFGDTIKHLRQANFIKDFIQVTVLEAGTLIAENKSTSRKKLYPLTESQIHAREGHLEVFIIIFFKNLLQSQMPNQKT